MPWLAARVHNTDALSLRLCAEEIQQGAELCVVLQRVGAERTVAAFVVGDAVFW